MAKILRGVLTENESGFDIDANVKRILRECKVPMECPCDEDCPESEDVTTDLREAVTLLAQRVLDLEARVTALGG